MIHATIPNGKTRCNEASLARSILAGDLPKADYPIFTRQQWMDEAQGALDTGDTTELRWMIDQQDEADREEHRLAVLAYRGVHPRKRSWWEG